MRRSGQRNQKGQVFIEVVCGMMLVLVPIALAALDITVLVLGNSANDSLAKSCARAAANEKNSGNALSAAEQVVSRFPASALVEKVVLNTSQFNYSTNQNVTVETVVTVRMPVPVPLVEQKIDFRARATEPVVGVSAAPGQSNI